MLNAYGRRQKAEGRGTYRNALGNLKCLGSPYVVCREEFSPYYELFKSLSLDMGINSKLKI
ncbi:MAG: hypothetical protein HC786_33695 [Richelia sp. CSU_2_1]|nr:hypothetical protein [Richelia sp. CSU_2_1]